MAIAVTGAFLATKERAFLLFGSSHAAPAASMSFLGAPPPLPRARKRVRGEEAVLATEAPPPVEFCVVGFRAHTHAGGPALEELLHGWAGDVCVTVDRWDALNMLPEWTPPPAHRRWCVHIEEDAEALDEERYCDLRALQQREQDAGA